MAKRTHASQERRRIIKELNAKIENLSGQVQSLKFEIEDITTARDELLNTDAALADNREGGQSEDLPIDPATVDHDGELRSKEEMPGYAKG